MSKLFNRKDQIPDLLALGSEDAKQNRLERLKYAHKSYYLVIRYICAVILIIFLVGINIISLSDSVIMCLIGSTLGQVIGLFAYVMKYLFRYEDNSNKSK